MNIDGWPYGYQHLHNRRISDDTVLYFAYSNIEDKFAIIPVRDAEGDEEFDVADPKPIIIAPKYDTSALRAKLHDFAWPSHEELDRDLRFPKVRGFEVYDSAMVSSRMKVAFAYKPRTMEHALIRKIGSLVLRPIVIEEKYDNDGLYAALERFAKGTYRVRRNRSGGRGWTPSTESKPGGSAVGMIHGYKNRSGFRLPNQSDWGDS